MLHQRFTSGPRTHSALGQQLASALILFLVLLMHVTSSPAQQADDLYLRVFNLIQDADALAAKSDTDRAVSKYREAYKLLENLKREFPEWQPQVVKFRSQYLARRINELMNPPIQAPAATQAGTNAAPGHATSLPEGFRVELLERGTEPHDALRWRPEPGSKQTFVLTQKTSMSITAGDGTARPMALPPIRLTLEVTTKTVSGEGDIGYETVIRDATIVQDTNANPQANLLLTGMLGAFKGASATGTITATGVPKSVQVKLPEAAASVPGGGQQLQQLFGEIALPLPEEPVGPGAKWRVTKPSNIQGVRLVETATHQLASVSEGRLQIRSTSENKAAPQKIQAVEITKLEVQTTAEMTLDLKMLLPQTATVRSRTVTGQKQQTGATATSVSSTINTELTIEAK